MSPDPRPTAENLKPEGPSVKFNVPPNWFLNVSALSRQPYNQVMRLRITLDEDSSTFFFQNKINESNTTMRISKKDTSLAHVAHDTDQVVELTFLFSRQAKSQRSPRDPGLEKAKKLLVKKVEKPQHLDDDFPDFTTFYVFAQDEEDKVGFTSFDDAVGIVNLVRKQASLPAPTGYPAITGPNATDPGSLDTTGPDTSNIPTDANSSDMGTHPRSKALDLLFIQDTTGSQEPYIKAVTDSIQHICDEIAGKLGGQNGRLRVGHIAFRDHPPQETTYVTKEFEFTPDIAALKTYLSTLTADGGGDGPEAVAAALTKSMSMDWRPDATKMSIIIADAPPHGIGEPWDDFPDGGPDKDPLLLADRMAEFGIVVHVIACEPALSNTRRGPEFYNGLCKRTSGVYMALSAAKDLPSYIINKAFEAIELEEIIAEHGAEIARRVLFKKESMDGVAEEMKKILTDNGIQISQIDIENIYQDSPERTRNVEIWKTADGLKTGRDRATDIAGSRLLAKFSWGNTKPQVNISKAPIGLDQSKRVVLQSVARNADVGPGTYTTRPTAVSTGAVVTVDVPAQWVSYITAFSRSSYYHMIRIRSTTDENTNTDYLCSRWGLDNDLMVVEANHEMTFVAAAWEESLQLELSLLHCKEKIDRISERKRKASASSGVRIMEDRTPSMMLKHEYPDYVTYIVLGEDKYEGVNKEFDDIVAIITVIKTSVLTGAAL